MSYNLEVRFEGSAKALAPLERAVKGRNIEVTLSFDGENLDIEAVGVGQSFPATGSWPGTVIVRKEFLNVLKFSASRAQSLVLRVEGDRLWLGSATVPCAVQHTKAPEIFVPTNASLRYLLVLRAKHADAALSASGAMPLIVDAEARRDRLVAKAAELLAPMGVETADLRELVDQTVKREG
jgi:hypothetical protein